MIEMQQLAKLDSAQVAQNLSELIQRVSEDNPTLDLRRGVFNDLLAYYQAVLTTQRQVNINDYLRARSLAALEADPELADTDLVDDVLSNFRVTRKPGAKARGDVTLVVDSDITVVLGQGAVFQGNGKRFVTERVYTAKSDAAQVTGASDRVLLPTADGNWAFTFEIVAEDEGADSEVKKDTLLLPLIVPRGFVTSFAAADFTGGLSAETNTQMLTALQAGVAAKTLSNRVNMQAMLREIDAFARVVAMSIVGLGDPEMLRDRHTIFPVALGGRCDWYIRTQEKLLHSVVTKTAVLVSKSDDNTSTWQVALTREDSPGFYEVTNIRPNGTTSALGGFTVTSDVRDLDMTGDGFRPDVANINEGAYSRFQTTVLQFEDTETDVRALSAGATAAYDLEIVGMPLVGSIQDTISSRDVRHYGADCLIKAPVPCFVQISFTIYRRAADADPDLDGIKEALATEINNIGFVGAVYASQVHDVVHGFLRNDQTVSAVDLLGRLRYPSGRQRYLRDSERLEVPNEPESMVSSQTVQFFIAPDDIAISVTAGVPTAL